MNQALLAPYPAGPVGAACCNIVAEPPNFCRIPIAKVLEIRWPDRSLQL